MLYMSHKCREKNPADRLSAIEVEIYLTLLRKKLKKFKEDGQSSPISSVAWTVILCSRRTSRGILSKDFNIFYYLLNSGGFEAFSFVKD